MEKIHIKTQLISEGIWMLYYGFDHRMCYDGMGIGSDDPLGYSFYFSKPEYEENEFNPISVELITSLPQKVYTFACMDKSEFHVFFISQDKYEKIML